MNNKMLNNIRDIALYSGFIILILYWIVESLMLILPLSWFQ